MTENKIFFTKADGKVKAILNWRTRKDGDVLLLSDTFNNEDMTLYHDLKDLGEDDRFIFNTFFPSKETKKLITESKKESGGKAVGTLEVTINIEQLTKPQIAFLIQREMKTLLPSLKNMAKEDLVKLFLELVE
jgi:hypothetical protein